MWQTLKQILPTNGKQTTFCDPPTKLCDFSNNTFLENLKDIAESFNTYFVNIGKLKPISKGGQVNAKR